MRTRCLMLVLALAGSACGARSELPVPPPAAHALPPAPSCAKPAPVPTVLYHDPKKRVVYLAVDADALYFTDPLTDQRVTRVSKCDGTSRELAGLPNDLGSNAASLAALPHDVVYLNLIDLGGEVILTPIEPGGEGRLLASTTQPLSDSIGVDADAVYFGDGALERVPLAGGAPTPLAPGWLGVGAVDDAHVYVDQSPPTGVALGSVAKAGGPMTVLANPVNASGGFALDDEAIYWAAWHDQGPGSAVVRVPKGGGDLEVLVANEDSPQGIAVDDTHVYWGARGSPEDAAVLRRAAKDGSGIAETFVAGPVWIFVIDQRTVYWSTGHDLMKLDK
jgi:hypothetical protein